ncbi:MAG: tetratricopeptide repeat protein, partial [Gemmatimonadales bacterium]
PARFEAYLALGDYQRSVREDLARAIDAYSSSLRLATSAAGLRGMASTEHSLGRWDSALEHARQAQALDPRAAFAIRQRAITLVWLGRYTEAQAVLDQGLALDSTHLSLVLWKTIVLLGQGDLAGARAFLRTVPKEVDPTVLAAYLGRYSDLFWVLDEEHQSLLLRLTPGPFNDDRAIWGLTLAATHHLRGDTVRAHAYADSARLAFEALVEASPDNAQLRSLLGTALAYLGRPADAVREGERAVALTPISRDAHTGPYLQHQLVRIYILVGEYEKALDRLEPLLRIPYYLSPAWLRIDPTFDPIREQPRFKRLVAVGG